MKTKSPTKSPYRAYRGGAFYGVKDRNLSAAHREFAVPDDSDGLSFRIAWTAGKR